jgi:hypothetical protein
MGISGAVAMAGVALFLSAALVLLLPTSQGPTERAGYTSAC